MGFFEGILNNVTSTISSTISGEANRAARDAAQNATQKALSAETYAGLNVKAIVDKTKFLKKEDGSYEIYFDSRLAGTISEYQIKEIKGNPMDVAKTKLKDILGNMKNEFKNQKIADELVKKFLAQMD